MKKAVDLDPIRFKTIAGCAEHPGAGVARARNDVAVFHHWKLGSELARSSAYLHWAAVNFEKPHRCAEVGAWGHWRGQEERGKGCTDDRDQDDCEGDG